jgi:uncharacterized protein YggE
MRILAFLFAAALAVPFAAQAEGTLTVAGEARVAVVPDMATVSLGAVGRGQTAVAAMNATSAAVDAILARLASLGIESRDIQTTQLRVNEETRWDNNRNEDVFLGYIAQNSVRVRVRDMEQLSPLMAAVLDEGANRLQNLDFGLQEPRKAEDEARRRAVADAIAKADLYATAAGVEVGNVISLRDTAEPIVRSMARAEPMIMAEAVVLDVPVAAGEIEIRAEVTMVFAIGN